MSRRETSSGHVSVVRQLSFCKSGDANYFCVVCLFAVSAYNGSYYALLKNNNICSPILFIINLLLMGDWGDIVSDEIITKKSV